MATSKILSQTLLFSYGLVNKSGLLDVSIVRRMFIRAYFFYKTHFEDSIAPFLAQYTEVVQGGDIYDVGANIGYTANIFSRYTSGGAQVLAFEPDVRNFEMLNRTIFELGIQEKVVCVQAAVGDRQGEIKLWLNQTHHADHRVVPESFDKSIDKKDQLATVPLLTIDEYRKKNRSGQRVCLIKIDVQGYEAGVCRGMEQTLADFPDAVIIFEHSPFSARELGFQPDEVPEFFVQRGYGLIVLQRRGKIFPVTIPELERSLSSGGYIDVIATKNPARLFQ